MRYINAFHHLSCLYLRHLSLMFKVSFPFTKQTKYIVVNQLDRTIVSFQIQDDEVFLFAFSCFFPAGLLLACPGVLGFSFEWHHCVCVFFVFVGMIVFFVVVVGIIFFLFVVGMIVFFVWRWHHCVSTHRNTFTWRPSFRGDG